MPVSDYFSGNGGKVMQNMKNEYGEDKGKSVFYATANKKDAAPKKKRGIGHKIAMKQMEK